MLKEMGNPWRGSRLGCGCVGVIAVLGLWVYFWECFFRHFFCGFGCWCNGWEHTTVGDQGGDKIVALSKRALIFLNPSHQSVDGGFGVIHPCWRCWVKVGEVGHVLGEVVVEFARFLDVGFADEEALQFECCLGGGLDGLQHLHVLGGWKEFHICRVE